MAQHPKTRREALALEPSPQRSSVDFSPVIGSVARDMVYCQELVSHLSTARAFPAIVSQHLLAQFAISLNYLRTVFGSLSPSLHDLSSISFTLFFRFGKLIAFKSRFLFGPDDRIAPPPPPILPHVITVLGFLWISLPAALAGTCRLRFHRFLAFQTSRIDRHVGILSQPHVICNPPPQEPACTPV